ncbi:MAG: phosphoribosylformylglycinamidine synthase [Erysipelotrichaceae bacterium]|nr:phosphoribosylformylglycinamidine synthase [Erysipelotrichaceae bacterium]
MVSRVYVEKKAGYAPEAAALKKECRSFLGIEGVEDVRILHRYDVEGLAPELFEEAKTKVFSEPQIDVIYDKLEGFNEDCRFAVEALPGQFDQRADSAAQCIELLTQEKRPTVRYAKIILLYGKVAPEDLERIKHYMINPVESREASFALPETLKEEIAEPADVKVLDGFRALKEEELKGFREEYGLAMGEDDLLFLQAYCREIGRDPTMTELRIVDTYWSDHCRHTTFSTVLENIEIEDPEVKASYDRYQKLREEVYGADTKRPVTLMDLATIGAKTLKKRGLCPEIDESEEINACSIHIEPEIDGKKEDWLLMFKNETHNHPTEIEPFGGAATCIGGCIRDPLSGRVYVHQAMRYTGGGDPRAKMKDTLEGKLPQRKLAQTAAAGYSSYGNQIGLATGLVSEVYHEGYIAKRLECGAVVGAAPAENVVRERPQAGDVILLLGGRTGRDGIGGATGSSKTHNLKSLQTMASEVQKGNAPEERKIQRLFRKGEVTRMIKRCNDFGAGGVSVAIGELAEGLKIDLDQVRKKYDGLDGTELAISESQERMAVVLAKEDVDRFIKEAEKENLEAYRVAEVTEEPKLIMTWRGKTVAEIDRSFLDTNGARKKTSVAVPVKDREGICELPYNNLKEMASSLKCASRRGLIDRFDSTVGAYNVLMPTGGRYRRTVERKMVSLIPVDPGKHSSQASIMAWGADPDQMVKDPYTGAYNAVYNSIAKLTAGGADPEKIYLTFQEFFERLREEPQRWGKPFEALLGALDAQIECGAAAIGGKDSMSGSFLDKDVPPTLISFAIAPIDAGQVISSDFKKAGHKVVLINSDERKEMFGLYQAFAKETAAGKVYAAATAEYGIGEALMNMGFGNRIGFKAEKAFNAYTALPAALIAEVDEDFTLGETLGYTSEEEAIVLENEAITLKEAEELNDAVLEKVYPTKAECPDKEICTITSDKKQAAFLKPEFRCARPKALIPVFPGTNCEYDTANALIEAGADAEIFVVRNHSSEEVRESAENFAFKIREAQMIVIPGGFSGGDEPDGSAKFITAFFRNPAIKEELGVFLDQKGGLMLGICNGFQALIKLGLVPYGKIVEPSSAAPTLSYNTIGRHQSQIVATRVSSKLSPWLAEAELGGIYQVPISHGEGRFIIEPELAKQLIANGQVATQYVDLEGNATYDSNFNPNGSYLAIEGITSPDGRILGKMGHSERIRPGLYKNILGETDMKLFVSAVKYFK